MVHDPGRLGGACTHYIVNDDLRENVEGMSTALQDFKPITYAMGAEDSEDIG